MRISERKLEDAERRLVELKKHIIDVRDEEMDRLIKEYKQNRYEERFNIGIKKLAMVIFGEKDKSKYLKMINS